MMNLPKLKVLASAGCALVLSVAGLSSFAAERRSGPNYFQEDFPFQGACISAKWPEKNVAMKGFAIRVGNDANMLWDTDLLRFAAGWTGGYISGNGVTYNGSHGQHPAIVGAQHFGTKPGPGWANAKGEFTDDRPEPFGPLSKDWCRWDGMYVNGSNVVLAYTVHGTKIYEQPSSVAHDGEVAFVRTFRIGEPPLLDGKSSGNREKPAVTGVELKFKGGVTDLQPRNSRSPLTLTPGTRTGASILSPLGPGSLMLLVCDVEQAAGVVSGNMATLKHGDEVTMVRIVDAPTGSTLQLIEPGRLALKLGPKPAGALFKVVLWKGRTDKAAGFTALAVGKPRMVEFARGGLAHWPEVVPAKGVLNTSHTPDGAYVTDSITAPTPNPWNRRVRFGGMDFFSDGKRAALCTHEGDVWIVEGIDETLGNLKWRRFASGQYETLGLAIVNDVIYTSGRDQLTRYHDLNKDGEADFYENFNNEIQSTEGFHEFVFDLQTDRKGNFYFAKANPVNSGGGGFGNQKASMGNGTVCSHSGCLFKVSKDGKKFEILARGFRAPNGIGVSADGQVTTSDNEGTWVPTTPIHWVKPGGFHGVINSKIPNEVADGFIPPLAWLSKDYDNSGGGQIWVTSKKWGPFQGELLHESYGKSSLFLVMREQAANGVMQGGVVRFPLKFTSSCMRAHFNEKDGQLYIAGLSEWQSNASKPTGFDRVRYTGKPVYSVRGLKVLKSGVQLTFTQPLATDSVTDLQNWSGKRWNYARTQNYGSPEFSLVADENGKPRKGRDTLDITGARLSADGKTVTLTIADFKPAMSETIKFNLKAADGTPVAQEIQHTIHAIP